jgi:hypothetical protein
LKIGIVFVVINADGTDVAFGFLVEVINRTAGDQNDRYQPPDAAPMTLAALLAPIHSYLLVLDY